MWWAVFVCSIRRIPPDKARVNVVMLPNPTRIESPGTHGVALLIDQCTVVVEQALSSVIMLDHIAHPIERDYARISFA